MSITLSGSNLNVQTGSTARYLVEKVLKLVLGKPELLFQRDFSSGLLSNQDTADARVISEEQE